jgi:ABC-type oligopeptide transport system ATPase subunit
MSALLEVQNLVKLFPVSGSRKVVQAVNGVDFASRRRFDRSDCGRNLV